MVKILLESSSRQAKDKKVAWSYGGEIVLHQPDSFLQWDEWLGGWGEQWMLLVLTLARLSALSPISSWTSWESMGWISEQWGGLKKGWLARLKNSHLCCKVQVEVIPYWCNQTLILRSALLNIFINNLSDWTECSNSKFANETKLGGGADPSEGCSAIQWDLGRQEKWTERNL